MGRQGQPDDRMRHFDEDREDSAVAELLRRAYARRVDLDTAARHLWAIDVAARSRRRAERAGRSRRAVVAVLTSLMVVATSGVGVAASNGALPGDPLYSLKRGTERVRLVLAVNPETDAQVHLAIARKRWDEAQRAAEARPDVVPDLLKDTFVALQAAEQRGGAAASEAVALRSEITENSSRIALGERPPSAPAAEEAPDEPAPVPFTQGPSPEADAEAPAEPTPPASPEPTASPSPPADEPPSSDAATVEPEQTPGGSDTWRAPPESAESPAQETPTAAPTATPEAPAPEPGTVPPPATDGGGGDTSAGEPDAQPDAQPGAPPADGPETPAEQPESAADPAPAAAPDDGDGERPSAPGWGRPRP